MKLITLNTWGGQVFESLMRFIERHAVETDIFCFQEVLFGEDERFTPIHRARVNLYTEIKKRLDDFSGFERHAPGATHFQSESLDGIQVGQAIFVRKNIAVKADGSFQAYRVLPEGMVFGGKISGSCQWIELQDTTTILNLHGLWQKGTGKKDTPERLEQSRTIAEFLSAQQDRKIVCGDFNLLPDTESMAVLERGMRNLIKEFGITSTRSELYTKPERHADYVLISPDIVVHDFKVFPDVVSDHLPLMVEFA